MCMAIRIGILGYGNLGRGVEYAVASNPDMELAAIITRRSPKSLNTITEGVKKFNIEDISKLKDDIDVMILCGGSASDLPVQTPRFAEMFNVVDSFDTHSNINRHFEAVDCNAKRGKKTAIISVGWDPGLFSLNRLYADAVLPQGNGCTFWGSGVSQGHSDAIRKIEGVKDARQYTIPIEKAIESVRNGNSEELLARDKHLRECFVVVDEGVDHSQIEYEIKTMPNYFADYDTIVHFISEEELLKNHSSMPHGGTVIRTGYTGDNAQHKSTIEYSLKLGSNPEFTASVIVSYARAAFRMSSEGKVGCHTVFDIPPAYLLSDSDANIRKKYL